MFAFKIKSFAGSGKFPGWFLFLINAMVQITI